MFSYWEKTSFFNYDYIIIGSGITGLSTAISLKERSPYCSVLILERGLLPTGASTKNAGFACFGSAGELLADLKENPPEEVTALVDKRWKGLQKLKKRLGSKTIDLKSFGGYELITEKEISVIEGLGKLNDLLYPQFNENVFLPADKKIKDFGFDERTVHHLIYNPFEGQINTGKMMRALLSYARKLDIEVITGSEVQEINEDQNQVHVKVINKSFPQDIDFSAQKVAICTNAFSKKFLPNEDLKPGRGLVLVTKPVENLTLKGIFHMDEGFYYFRNIENRIIFGGGRNLDFDKEATTNFGINEHIKNDLLDKLQNMILPGRKVKIDYFWSGIMAFGKERKPIIKKVSDKIITGVRLGGMGIAIGSLVGEEVATHILEISE